MSKILKNQTGSDVAINDVGVTVPASGQITVQSTDDLLFAGSDDVVTLVGNGTLVVNDGTNDLSISDGIDLIKGIFPKQVEIASTTTSLGSSTNPLTTSVKVDPDLPVTLRRSDIQELKEEFSSLKETLILLARDVTSIRDGRGSGRYAGVNEYNALKVVDQRIPSSEDETLLVPIQLDLATTAGSTDMRVAGTLAAPIDFILNADPTSDIFIDSISFRIADVNATADKFGNITALTNGCQLIYSDLDNGEIVIGKELKSNFDFIRLCQGEPAFGNDAGALRIANVAGNSEGYIPVLDFSDMFGLPWGVRLRAGSQERLILRVRDNTSTVDAFDAVCFGFKKVK